MGYYRLFRVIPGYYGLFRVIMGFCRTGVFLLLPYSTLLCVD